VRQQWFRFRSANVNREFIWGHTIITQHAAYKSILEDGGNIYICISELKHYRKVSQYG